ncbi:MAG: hypothetical protein WD688_00230 [Candidatus Binatia bacterium]
MTLLFIHFTMLGMKQCPDCSARYGDNVAFCAKDGKALAGTSHNRSRLCPHCANSIQEDAAQCPYCKADLTSIGVPQWPTREEMSGAAARGRDDNPLSVQSKAILIAGFIVFALGVFLIGGHQQRNETRELKEANLKKLQDRELKIQTLEGQLKQIRQELDDSTSQIAALTAKLQESQKEHSATQQQLSSRAPTTPRPTARSTQAPPTPKPPARPAEPGVYQVIRTTTVREKPSAGALALATIGKGTKITVVGAAGEWLEVRSKQGKPPGFVRLDDAMFIGRAN